MMNDTCDGCIVQGCGIFDDKRCDFYEPSPLDLEGTRIHYIKILPQYFKEVAQGNKTFEVRTDDRDYQVDDYVVLREWTVTGYTGVSQVVQITYLLGREPEHKQYVAEGKVIFSFKHYYSTASEALALFKKLKAMEKEESTVSDT